MKQSLKQVNEMLKNTDWRISKTVSWRCPYQVWNIKHRKVSACVGLMTIEGCKRIMTDSHLESRSYFQDVPEHMASDYLEIINLDVIK